MALKLELNNTDKEMIKALLFIHLKSVFGDLFIENNDKYLKFVNKIINKLFIKEKLIDEVRQGLNITLLTKTISDVILYKSNADENVRNYMSVYLKSVFGVEKDQIKKFLCIKNGVNVDIYLISPTVNNWKNEIDRLIFSNHSMQSFNNTMRIEYINSSLY